MTIYCSFLGMFYENVIYCKRYEGSFSLNCLLDSERLRCVNDSVLFSCAFVFMVHHRSFFLLLTRIFICLETITVKGLG